MHCHHRTYVLQYFCIFVVCFVVWIFWGGGCFVCSQRSSLHPKVSGVGKKKKEEEEEEKERKSV